MGGALTVIFQRNHIMGSHWHLFWCDDQVRWAGASRCGVWCLPPVIGSHSSASYQVCGAGPIHCFIHSRFFTHKMETVTSTLTLESLEQNHGQGRYSIYVTFFFFFFFSLSWLSSLPKKMKGQNWKNPRAAETALDWYLGSNWFFFPLGKKNYTFASKIWRVAIMIHAHMIHRESWS